MNNIKDNSNNRRLYSDELYFLLQRLGVVGNFPGSKDSEFIKLYRNSDGIYGDPTNVKSMFNLIYLLTSLGVNVYDSKNWQIIKEAIYQKQKLEDLYFTVPKTNIVYENTMKQQETSVTEMANLKEIVVKTMDELGFDSNNIGYYLFADCVLYLLQKKDSTSLNDSLYPFLEKKYKMEFRKIDYNIRKMIKARKPQSLDTEVSHYVYKEQKNIKNLECLYLVVEYIKQKDVYTETNNKTSTNQSEFDISKMFHQLGIYPNIIGCQYLKDAIFYLINTNEPITCMELYQYIANEHGKTVVSVEKAMRQAIANGLNHFQKLSFTDQTQIPDIGNYIYKEKNKISNFDFIRLMLEYLNEKLPSQERVFQESNFIHGNTKRRTK